MQRYDLVVVGSGLWGATFAYEAAKRGRRVLVIEKRNHIGGNIYTHNIDGINVQRYGAHIFNTNRKDIWDYINQFASFNNYVNHVYAVNKNRLYSMPINLATMQEIYGEKLGKIITPSIAKRLIEQAQNTTEPTEPTDLEAYSISLVGKEIYQVLIKDYTEKQWGRSAKELPSSILARIPVRYTYDNNYYCSTYQGIPIGGYTQIIEKMLEKCDISLNTDFFERNPKEWYEIANTVVYTGMIDRFYDYRFGYLEYRSLRFEEKRFDDVEDFQGNAVINYTGREVAYTRVIEHKHFEFGKQPFTIVSWEYPLDYDPWGEVEPYYPINDERNMSLYGRYAKLARKEKNTIFGGRLGSYRYTNMQDTLIDVLEASKKYLEETDK